MLQHNVVHQPDIPPRKLVPFLLTAPRRESPSTGALRPRLRPQVRRGHFLEESLELKRPLTQEQAAAVSVGYLAMAEIIAEEG